MDLETLGWLDEIRRQQLQALGALEAQRDLLHKLQREVTSMATDLSRLQEQATRNGQLVGQVLDRLGQGGGADQGEIDAIATALSGNNDRMQAALEAPPVPVPPPEPPGAPQAQQAPQTPQERKGPRQPGQRA